MVWLKIGKHDIIALAKAIILVVVVWLKIGKHDIFELENIDEMRVVVWLKIGKHDITSNIQFNVLPLWFD